MSVRTGVLGLLVLLLFTFGSAHGEEKCETDFEKSSKLFKEALGVDVDLAKLPEFEGMFGRFKAKNKIYRESASSAVWVRATIPAGWSKVEVDVPVTTCKINGELFVSLLTSKGTTPNPDKNKPPIPVTQRYDNVPESVRLKVTLKTDKKAIVFTGSFEDKVLASEAPFGAR